jgi:hypothetical protein
LKVIGVSMVSLSGHRLGPVFSETAGGCSAGIAAGGCGRLTSAVPFP